MQVVYFQIALRHDLTLVIEQEQILHVCSESKIKELAAEKTYLL